MLDGALSLAVPTKYGQSLTVEKNNLSKITWESLNEKGAIWLKFEFELGTDGTLLEASNYKGSKVVFDILNVAKQLNPEFLNTNKTGFKITTKLDFAENWGLGSSSTLINNIAQWAKVDAFKLLKSAFGGSGYDIACAQHDTPITFQLKNNSQEVLELDFNPSFKEHLYFVHLNKKQNSREGIKQYQKNKTNASSAAIVINDITTTMINSDSLEVFEELLMRHESLISKITKQRPIKERLFTNFPGCIKSLGAWGGDFVLVTCKTNPKDYFKEKGFETVIRYTDMVL